MKNKKLKIKLTEYSNSCIDGCCTDYGIRIIVNGVEMPFDSTDITTILRQVLEYLGYEVKIDYEFTETL